MSYRSYRTRQSPVVLVLIFINVMAYIATSIVSKSFFGLSYAQVFQLGISSATFTSQPWNLLTAMFVHDGILHIFFNMLMLFYFGSYVVQLIGEIRFLIVYLIGGIVGNFAFMLLSSGFAVGASGAIFALGGVLAVMRPRLKVVLFPIPIPMDLWIAVLLGFVLVSFLGGVAWQAHLGGLVTGLVAGYFFRRREQGSYYR